MPTRSSATRIAQLALFVFFTTLSVGTSRWATAQESAPPSARDDEAHALFEAGRLAFSAGNYEDAYSRFSESYALSARPELLYNLASAADRLRRDELALAHYRAFLTALPETAHRSAVEHRIAILVGARVDEGPTATGVQNAVPLEESQPAPAAAPAATPIWEEWWLWTIVGVAIAGGIALGVGLATTQPSVAAPIRGDVGPDGVVLALSVPVGP